ncbi:MAG: ribokinase [SAR202 cluster bacterium]|nr:ribokinase [SAR202 cluster bacterium]
MPTTPRPGSVVVLGAVNMDLVVTVPRLPAPGETLIGGPFVTTPGGKGANQAVAAARMGARTTFVGRVGVDAHGASLLDSMRADGIDVGQIAIDPDASSGVALITVAARGDNTVIAVPGANGRCDGAEARRAAGLMREADVLLLQMEVPPAVSLAAAREAKRLGKRVVMNPAPAAHLPADAYALFDCLTPNETEAQAFVGYAIDGPGAGERAARELVARGASTAVVTLGARGIAYATQDLVGALPAFSVDAVDTVACGDAFAGAFAAALAEGQPFVATLRWGMAAGALCATRRGAQAAMPGRADVLRLASGAYSSSMYL